MFAKSVFAVGLSLAAAQPTFAYYNYGYGYGYGSNLLYPLTNTLNYTLSAPYYVLNRTLQQTMLSPYGYAPYGNTYANYNPIRSAYYGQYSNPTGGVSYSPNNQFNNQFNGQYNGQYNNSANNQFAYGRQPQPAAPQNLGAMPPSAPHASAAGGSGSFNSGLIDVLNNKYRGDVSRGFRDPDVVRWARAANLEVPDAGTLNTLGKTRKSAISSVLHDPSMDSNAKIDALRILLR